MRKVGSGIPALAGCFDAELLKLVARANHLRIVFGVAQAAQRDDGVQHGRIDGAEAVGHLQPLQHPLLRLLQRELAQRANVHRFGPVHHAIENEEEIAPGDELLAIPAQTQNRVGAAADEQLVDSLLRRNLLERLLGVDDRQRHQNRARPRRKFRRC